MYHTDIVIEIAKSYKRLTIYDGRKANLLLSAAREGHQKRPSQTPIPHTKVSIDITFPREVFLIMLTFSPLRSCMALHCYLFLRRKNMIKIKIFITRWPRGKKASSLAASGSCTFKFDMFEHLYLLSMPGH